MRKRSLITGCAALTLALAGCGEAEPGPTVVGPASPGAASSPSPSPPGSTAASPQTPGSPTATRGDQLDEETRRQLLAAPVDYYEAIERAYTTLDYSEVERLSSDSCGGCGQQLAYLREAAESRHQHAGGQYTVKGERVMGPLRDGRWAVGLVLDSTNLTIKDSSGELIQEAKGVTGRRQQINLIRENGAWVVDDIFGLE